MNYIIKRAREESDGPAAALRAAVGGRRGGAGYGGCRWRHALTHVVLVRRFFGATLDHVRLRALAETVVCDECAEQR